MHVRFEVGALVEASIADRAFMGRFLQVRHFMHRKCSRLTEALAAVIALEWLFFGVNISVISEMVLATEGLSADVTAVGAFISVGSLVDQ